GSGFIAHCFEEANCVVHPFDLFPENNKYAVALCQPIDLQRTLPIASASADIVVLAETIEHIPDQLSLFAEIARILKPGGHLILTTPNSSSLRSRFSQFMIESEHYAVAPPNETTAFVEWDGHRQRYLGKLFVSGLLRLRALAAMHGLKIKTIHSSPWSSTSFFLLLTFPLIYFFAARTRRQLVRARPADRPVYEEIFRISTSLNILLGKHLFVEFVREQ
ncbi:MAG TPA: class I SAM-dependent methyltransferase, partial [Cyclobacteriaceae bacterium]|nr:class I SAM-dependent methyltransferase [Cyclobacteriaceae bacterium]